MKLLEIREIKIGDNLFLGTYYNCLNEDCIEWINRTSKLTDWIRYYDNIYLKLDNLISIRRVVI